MSMYTIALILLHCPQSLIYLLSGRLPKKFAHPCQSLFFECPTQFLDLCFVGDLAIYSTSLLVIPQTSGYQTSVSSWFKFLIFQTLLPIIPAHAFYNSTQVSTTFCFRENRQSSDSTSFSLLLIFLIVSSLSLLSSSSAIIYNNNQSLAYTHTHLFSYIMLTWLNYNLKNFGSFYLWNKTESDVELRSLNFKWPLNGYWKSFISSPFSLPLIQMWSVFQPMVQSTCCLLL